MFQMNFLLLRKKSHIFFLKICIFLFPGIMGINGFGNKEAIL